MSERCHFVKRGKYCECSVCGLRVEADDPTKIYAACPGSPRRFPPLLKQVKTYAKAVAKHIATGMETRTDEEVINLLQICETCEHFSEDRCTICGCRLNNSKNAFANKLRMKSQSCPEGKWT